MKLTLSLDKDLIEFAHKLAKDSNDSVSNMVASMLRHTRRTASGGLIKSDAVNSLYGISKKKPIPDKDELKKRMLRKHLG